MKRYFLYISYKGTNYHGWQKQANATSVQEKVEEALGIILQQETPVYGSGRTDTGVHALQQVAHFDTVQTAPDELQYKLNGVLPHDIAITGIKPVRPDAHARFDAVRRGYVYRLHHEKSPFLRGISAFYPRFSPSMNVLNELAEHFIGQKDFESFCRTKADVHHYNCEVFDAHWERKEKEWLFYITADRFLRGMVRAVVGTQMDFLAGRLKTTDIPAVFEKKQRKFAGTAADPTGLYLARVEYPKDIFI